jgi:hypothetical protein
MREEITKQRLVALMKELARDAPPRGAYRVYLVGGGTAVYLGRRRSRFTTTTPTLSFFPRLFAAFSGISMMRGNSLTAEW